MKSKELASVLLKVLGVYCIAQSLPYLGALPVLLAPQSSMASAAGVPWAMAGPWAVATSILVPLALLASAAMVLIYFNRQLVDRLFPTAEDPALEGGVLLEELYVLAFVITGVVLLARYVAFNLPAVIWKITMVWQDYSTLSQMYSRGMLTDAIGLIVSVALGLYLILGGRGIYGLIMKLRRGGSGRNAAAAGEGVSDQESG